MGKYIDAEKIRSVLQNTVNSMKEKDAKGERYDAFLNGKLSICEELSGCITSLLQQEQTPTEREIAEAHRYAEMIRERDKERIQQEQPEVELEKEIDEKWDEFVSSEGEREDFTRTARHFYELGLNAKKK